MWRPHVKWLVLLAGLFTLLNAVKPLVIDDAVYYYYAAHIAQDPADPYSFQLPNGEPANHVLAPPVLLYWWAGAMRLVGDNLFWCKVALLPFTLTFTFALYALCRRFTRQLTMPLVWMLVLSPIFLPGLNLMLDVPALALSCFALAVFMHACDRGSLGLALAAGLLTGLAMQTKYTALVIPAVLVLYGLMFRRIRLGMVAAALAATLFISWELAMALKYGESHFVHALGERSAPVVEKLKLCLPLVAILGGTAPALLLLGLVGLGYSRRVIFWAAGLIAGGFLLLAGVPESYATLLGEFTAGRTFLTVRSLVYGILGLAVVLSGGAVVWRLCKPTGLWQGQSVFRRGKRLDYFLVMWLALELAAYFALSPYPAVRRVMGVFLVGTILAGRLAARASRTRGQMGVVWGATAVSVALGLLYYFVDCTQFSAERRLVEMAVRQLSQLDPGATVWYSGLYGPFEDAARRAGMTRYPWTKEALYPSGGWALVLEKRACCSVNHPLQKYCEHVAGAAVAHFSVSARVPLRTCLCYYFGNTAMEHFEGPLAEGALYRLPD